MGNIFELNSEYIDLMNALEFIDESAEESINEELQLNEKEFEEKAVNYIKMIKKWEGDIETINTELRRLKELKDSKQLAIERLKNSLKYSMELRGKEREDLGLYKLGFRKSTAVNVDEEKLPKKWFNKVVKLNPNKKAITEALKAGRKIKGAFLEYRKNLTIK